MELADKGFLGELLLFSQGRPEQGRLLGVGVDPGRHQVLLEPAVEVVADGDLALLAALFPKPQDALGALSSSLARSCHRFRANEVRLQLSVLAYNLGNLWRVAPTFVLKYNIRTRSLADPGAIEDVLAVENDVVPFDLADVLEQGCVDAFLGDSPRAQSPRDLLGLPIDNARQNQRQAATGVHLLVQLASVDPPAAAVVDVPR